MPLTDAHAGSGNSLCDAVCSVFAASRFTMQAADIHSAIGEASLMNKVEAGIFARVIQDIEDACLDKCDLRTNAAICRDVGCMEMASATHPANRREVAPLRVHLSHSPTPTQPIDNPT